MTDRPLTFADLLRGHTRRRPVSARVPKHSKAKQKPADHRRKQKRRRQMAQASRRGGMLGRNKQVATFSRRKKTIIEVVAMVATGEKRKAA